MSSAFLSAAKYAILLAKDNDVSLLLGEIVLHPF